MKNICFVTIFLLGGCASNLIGPKISNNQDDLLQDESMLRYSKERLANYLQTKKNSYFPSSLCYLGDIDAGLNLLKKRLEKSRNSPSYWNQIGTCYYLNNNTIKASFYFKLAISVATEKKIKFASAHNNLGVLYLIDMKYRDADRQFKRAQKINKKLLTPKFNYAHLLLKFGHVEEAYTYFNDLFKINRTDVDVVYALGTCFLMKGDIKKALSFYDRIGEDFLQRADIAYNYAFALHLDNQNEKARKILDNSEEGRDLYQKKYKLQVKLNINKES